MHSESIETGAVMAGVFVLWEALKIIKELVKAKIGNGSSSNPNGTMKKQVEEMWKSNIQAPPTKNKELLYDVIALQKETAKNVNEMSHNSLKQSEHIEKMGEATTKTLYAVEALANKLD